MILREMNGIMGHVPAVHAPLVAEHGAAADTAVMYGGHGGRGCGFLLTGLRLLFIVQGSAAAEPGEREDGEDPLSRGEDTVPLVHFFLGT